MMKTKKIFLLTGLFLLIMSGCSSSKNLTGDEKAINETALHEAIVKREFSINVNRMNPLGGGSRMLTSPYSLEIKGDEVKSHLPFAGRAYNIPYGGGSGLVFNSTVTDYQSSFNAKGKAVIGFKTRSENDQLVYRIEIYPNGSTTIDVRSNNRQSITFNGTAVVGEAEGSQDI